jgi:hypothetical protein
MTTVPTDLVLSYLDEGIGRLVPAFHPRDVGAPRSRSRRSLYSDGIVARRHRVTRPEIR